MLYYVVHSKKFNLAYYMAKRMEWLTKQKSLILPYGMLLTHLFKFIMNENPDLYNKSYVLYDRVMNPLAAQLERKTRKDRGTRRGCHSTSSSTFDQPYSSHLNDDDDDGNDKGTLCASTPSPIHGVLDGAWVQGLRRNGVLDGAFGGIRDEEVVVGEGVVVTFSSLEMLTNSCLGGIMVSLIFLEGLEEEALVEFMIEWFEEDEDDKNNGKEDLFN
nr:pentatricopeptide repeat-containing protein [Tanacetum cinerariifolium]